LFQKVLFPPPPPPPLPGRIQGELSFSSLSVFPPSVELNDWRPLSPRQIRERVSFFDFLFFRLLGIRKLSFSFLVRGRDAGDPLFDLSFFLRRTGRWKAALFFSPLVAKRHFLPSFSERLSFFFFFLRATGAAWYDNSTLFSPFFFLLPPLRHQLVANSWVLPFFSLLLFSGG